jgi:hypothetical protein
MSLIWLSLPNKSIGQHLELTPGANELKPGRWESALFPGLSLTECNRARFDRIPHFLIVIALPDESLDGHSLHLSNRVSVGMIGSSTEKSRSET